MESEMRTAHLQAGGGQEERTTGAVGGCCGPLSWGGPALQGTGFPGRLGRLSAGAGGPGHDLSPAQPTST